MSYTPPGTTALNLDFTVPLNAPVFNFTISGYSPPPSGTPLFDFIDPLLSLDFEFAPYVPEPISKALLKSLAVRLRGQVYKYWICWVWRGGQRVRRYVIPGDPKTPGQLACRSKWACAHAAAKALDIDARSYWGKIGVRKKEPITWQQAFIQAYMLNLVDPITCRHIRNLQIR